jgi:chromosome partitioning protein
LSFGIVYDTVVISMKILSILSQKGGTGKTTLAINLAVTAARLFDGRVTLIDLDPQASAANWRDSRAEPSPDVVSAQANRLSHHLEAARQSGCRLVLVDTAPHSESTALAAARAADLVLIPCRPAILDLRAISNTIELIRLANTPGAVVLNAVPARGCLADEAAEAVAGYEVPLAPMRLTQRSAFMHSLTAGQGIQEYEPRGKGAREMQELFEWVCAAIDMPPMTSRT